MVKNSSDILITALNYYQAMVDKDFDTLASYLSPKVIFFSPLANLSGKDDVFNAAQNFGTALKDIKIRSKFINDNQVMLAYDMIMPEPIGKFPAAALLQFDGSKISQIELFYDATPFMDFE